MYQRAQEQAAASGDGAGAATDGAGAAEQEDVVDAEVVDEGK
jgi:hypothetical protein